MTTDLWADFNDVYDADYVWTSLRRSPDVAVPPAVGDQVRLYDTDGDSCLAEVTRAGGPIVYCRIEWSTWQPGPEPANGPDVHGDNMTDREPQPSDGLWTDDDYRTWCRMVQRDPDLSATRDAYDGAMRAHEETLRYLAETRTRDGEPADPTAGQLAAVGRLLAVLLDAGPHPDIHAAALQRLRSGWPTLYNALDVFVDAHTGQTLP